MIETDRLIKLNQDLATVREQQIDRAEELELLQSNEERTREREQILIGEIFEGESKLNELGVEVKREEDHIAKVTKLVTKYTAQAHERAERDRKLKASADEAARVVMAGGELEVAKEVAKASVPEPVIPPNPEIEE